MNEFGEKLKAARKKQNLSQQQLADLMEVTRVAITNYELGRNNPSFENVAKLSRILKTDLTNNKKELETKVIPLIGKSSCGIPKEYDLNGYDPIPVPIDIYREGMYCVEADGDSMSPKINNGDIVYCDPQKQIDSGNIVHYWIDGESGIKRYKINEAGTIISLIPINTEYDIITIHCDENVDLRMARIVGRIDKEF
ncbi:XRE family transcriptional regulator [Aliarcobacter butzleri]|uniref:XRE family transcriptional regulator n=1 Tax=Aliarcobacter butzleri TaxID=28197 RepID=UPI003AFA6374